MSKATEWFLIYAVSGAPTILQYKRLLMLLVFALAYLSYMCSFSAEWQLASQNQQMIHYCFWPQ